MAKHNWKELLDRLPPERLAKIEAEKQKQISEQQKAQDEHNAALDQRQQAASVDFKKNAVIEVCPVITMNADDAALMMQTALADYVYEYDKKGCLLALGYGSLYNHH